MAFCSTVSFSMPMRHGLDALYLESSVMKTNRSTANISGNLNNVCSLLILYGIYLSLFYRQVSSWLSHTLRGEGR